LGDANGHAKRVLTDGHHADSDDDISDSGIYRCLRAHVGLTDDRSVLLTDWIDGDIPKVHLVAPDIGKVGQRLARAVRRREPMEADINVDEP
jgi:hypothetical protein